MAAWYSLADYCQGHCLGKLFSTGVIMPPWGHLAMSQGNFNVTAGRESATGLEWDSAYYASMHRTQPLKMKSYLAPNVSSAIVEKYHSESRDPTPYSRGTISFII